MSNSERRQTLIAGEWTGAEDDGWRDNTEPADAKQSVAVVPACQAADAERALVAAADAFGQWRAIGHLGRGAILLRAAALLRERAESVARLISRENGKILNEASAEVAASADFLEYYGGLGRNAWGGLLPHPNPDVEVRTMEEPIGVVVAIGPWNDPLLTPARKVCPALIAGNTVVLKAAGDTPLSAIEFARVLVDAGLPAGVMSVITGSAGDVSETLLGSDLVAAVTFTGSNLIGARIARELAGRTVRFQGELGGKNAAVVLGDADLDRAVATIIAAGFAQAGQRCTATSRVIVDRAVAGDFVERLRGAAAGLRCGSPLDPETQMGPVASEQQLTDVLTAIERAREQGASPVAGGNRLQSGDLDRGYFIAPTIFDEVQAEMDVWRQEIFGPVLAVQAVDGIDQAIEAVNDSEYGLAAAIFTKDLSAVHAFVDGVEAGQVAVNLPTSGWPPHVPFGGFGSSGSGFKEQGLEGLRFYVRTKTVALSS
jgi:aldehyde dehydrogenase (NAD+)